VLGWEVTGAMKSTFAGTKSTGPLNSVSATLNTAAERARHMKTSPHVDSTARMVLISSNVFKFQQQTLKTSQDIISLTSIKLSLKKNINSDTFANQSTQSSSSTTGQIPSQNKENSDPTINDRFSAASAQPTKI
jgi:hypothetical protein